MNLPNKLTVARIVLVPFYLAAMLIDFRYHYLVAMVIFAVASITDFLDGLLQLDKAGYILADETTKTNIEGVFAIGDVRTKALRQIVTAVSDGAVAVHNAEEYLSR